MKKFTLFAIAVLFSVVAFAQKQKPVLKVFDRMELQVQPKVQVQGVALPLTTTAARKAPRRALLTPPEGATPVTYYTAGGQFMYYDGSSFVDYTNLVPSIQIAVDGTDIYLGGLSPFATDGWIKGTIDGTTATFAGGQAVDETVDASQYIVGSDDFSTLSENIVFTIDEAAGTLTASTPLIGIAESATSLSLYAYWMQPVFSLTEPAAPEVVTLPDGAVLEEFSISYTDLEEKAATGSVKIAFVGNDVYMSGISSYLPDALVKGTLDGTTVTFPADQYMGNYGGLVDINFCPTEFYGADVVFSYDAATETLTSEGTMFSFYAYSGSYYYDGYFASPVIKKVVEVAATPANPEITELKYSSSYGYYIYFNVPAVDTEGNGLLTSKLSYQLFADVEKEVSPLTFTPATHSKLTEEMSIFPYGFTEGYDIYAGQFYLNDVYSDTWNKIGIKSIYTGGGETHETEIQWYTIKNYAIDDLTAEITAAEALVADETYKTGQTALQVAIDAAKATAGSADATTEDVQNALNTLKDAEAVFKALNTAYNKLAAEIETATALKDSEGMVYGKDGLNQAINKANRALNSADATADSINAALAELQQAEQDFRDLNGAASVTWDARQQSYTNEQVVESAQLSPDFTLTLAQGEASYAPAYYTSGSALRVYYKNSFTITASDNVKAMTKIVITQSGSTYGTLLHANVGELTKSGSTLTWVGDAKEVVFTNFEEGATSSPQTRIRTITITYMGQPDQLVALPETAEVQAWTLTGQTVGSSSSNYDFPTEVAFDGENDIYVKGLFPYTKDTWAKGTIADGKATFPAQLIADSPDYGEKYYIFGSADGETISDFVLAYDAEAKTLTQETQYIYLNYMKKNAINPDYLESWQNLKLNFGIEEPVAAPEDLVTEEWNLSTTLYYSDEEMEPYTAKVQVGFTGDDLYIQGLNNNADQLWVKATKNAEGQYVVPALQYMGEVGFWAKTKYYFSAVDAEGNFTDAVFHYDAEAQMLSTTQSLVFNRGKQAMNPGSSYVNVTTIFVPQPVIVDALPYSNTLSATEATDVFTIIDANEDNSTWRFEAERASIGYTNSADVPHDDWLVSPAIKLEAGKNYKFAVDVWRTSTSGTEAFEVKVANANTAEALAAGAQVIENQNIEPTEATTYSNDAVTVTETGYYFFGIHATSPGDQYGLSANNFKVEEAEAVQPEEYYYKKVMAADELTDGEYLIVYEGEAPLAFNGALETLDAVNNGIDVTIVKDAIEATDVIDGATFTISMTDGTIKSASGLFIGNISDTNALKSSADEPYTNTITVTDGEADIVSAETHLRFNAASNQLRFRYYKSASYTNQKPIALYKKVAGTFDPGVEPQPGELATGTYYTVGGKFMINTESGFQDITSKMESVEVTVEGSTVKIAGLAYWFKDGAIEGTLDGNTITFASGQLVGSDDYGNEYLVGSNDGQTVTDIVFAYNPETQTLTSTTALIVESGKADAVAAYCYWENAAFSAIAPEMPEVVVLPEGAEVVAYNMAYKDKDNAEKSKPVNVAVVGNEVYFQGMSQYIPEAWVKGTLDGNTVTFPAMQYMGDYGNYGASYFFYGAAPVVFTYDAEAETYTATGEVYGVLGDQYYDGRYFDPVLSKVIEMAGTPATPSIDGIEDSQFGDIVDFTIPTVDTDGNPMVASKLSYQFFVDDENTPLTFTPEYFTKLTEEMTVIPYGFTDNYDIYEDYLYLNMPHDTWIRLGIQTIYTGGDEENKSEIFWFDMPVKEEPVVAPEGLVTEAYSFNATALEYDSEGANEPEAYSIIIQVGFDGDDVYFKGLAQDMPELWVKATKNAEGKYVIPASQYMGELEFYNYTFPYYWTATDAEGNLVDAVLDFNAETSTFTTSQTLALNAVKDELDYYMLYNDVIITKFNEVAATPATPTFDKFEIAEEVGYSTVYFDAPATDVDGNLLNTEKLFYTLWIEKDGEQKPYVFTAALYPKDFEEDVTEVPYKHDGYDIMSGGIVYLEDEIAELQSWTKVGVQSIYYGAGERRTSGIAWSDGSIETGIFDINTADGNVRFYDMQGRNVEKSHKGLTIVQKRDDKGNVKTMKIVR